MPSTLTNSIRYVVPKQKPRKNR